MKKEACFKIAYVVKSHGLKGELTISLMSDCPELQGLTSVFMEIKGQLVPHFISAVSVKGTKAYLQLEDIRSAEQADQLTGCSLYLSKSDRSPLPKGEFYSDEVIDFDVEDLQAGPLGKVKEVLETGPNRHLIVNYLGKEIMIPIHGPFIKNVVKTKKRIVVELPDGFLDI
ncbi:MAG: 16S rRNA processing protein RimM [Cyclobacteriaceae bacterium]|nr:16S rRNA processing protein RimM [Cyclobacteriaceae bacterium]